MSQPAPGRWLTSPDRARPCPGRISAIEHERFYSDPPSDSGLSGPAVPPALPPIPTATFMAQQAREDRECAEAERRKQSNKLWAACLAKSVTVAKQTENSPAPEATP